ncbi:EAL domain-containing protein [Chromobacterium sp. IIBBL 290-4]|uniref:two-component system response regulator n=1 Tax=Chromobacterium sp. IIBBL 290-4 TaxID=2953890 RepID=UPI0020B844E9|nr:EAL domain-containing protein [Chromobacterium sp. IIBBL 290-4]UTH72975.1 EAL domain-containing protein [Chromobacterium sp. IIBBL 290-4]
MFNDTLQEQVKILIVDDMASNIHVIREAVRDLGEVRFATSGQAALEIARRIVPDLILLDIEMPGMDGYAVCREIKTIPGLADIPVIFVTSHDQDGHELQALNLGGVDFLLKPLNVPIARARIQTQLNLRHQTRQLARARQDMADVLQYLPAFVASWNAELRNEFCNDQNGKWFGLGAAAILGMHLRKVLGEANFREVEPHLGAVLRGDNCAFDLCLTRRDGGVVYGQAALVHRPQASGEPGFLMLITDVTERRRAEQALRDEKERIRIMLNSIGDAVIATDTAGRVTFLNPIAEAMTGWQAREAMGETIEKVMPLRASDSGHVHDNPVRLVLSEQRAVGMAMNCSLQTRDGRLVEVEDSASPVLDHAGRLSGAIVVFHDVSEARALAVKMSHMAHHDALTNLPNRMLLKDRTLQALQQAAHVGERLGLFILDLDHFKTINDAMGHSTGDKLLQLVAKRLLELAQPGDTVSRQGGDEFFILKRGMPGIESLGAFASRLLKNLSEPYWLGEGRFDLSVSIGISVYPDDSQNQEELYRHADAAMYQAKEEGRNRFRFFSSEIEEALLTRQALERHIRMGAEQGGFVAFYQPKVLAPSGKVVGVEALMRWRKDTGEVVSPGAFIPLAEETGLILPLGRYILRQACLDGKRWADAGRRLKVAVNVSAVQIAEGCFSDTVRSIIAETGFDPCLLELEITEGVLAANVQQTMQVLSELKTLGVSIAIDDFGTGYSSLAYLKQFPIDVLKIDQSFVRDMLEDRSDAAIVAAIVNMAQGLELQLVAEGVERPEQESALLCLGCRVMQGYLYGRPMPAGELEQSLNADMSAAD